MAFRLERNAEPLPGYTLIERLGGGGFGEVWKCEAPGGLHKAIKFVYGNLEMTMDESGQRAGQELRAMSRVKSVRHPYILSLERYDIIDGQLLIVMELADCSLWDRYKDCRKQGLPGIPREELLRYLTESAEALDLMNHQHQLQHLDVKPQNIFLIHNHIKVADFGLAKDLEGTQASMTGGVTPVYAAPETFDGYLSRFSDQYSLAIVYQELLTGRRPFEGSNVRNLILQHLEAEPDVSPLPERDRPIIQRALSKQPDHRFPTCAEMVLRLVENSTNATTPAYGPASSPSGDSVPTLRSPHPSTTEIPGGTSVPLDTDPGMQTPQTPPSLPIDPKAIAGPARFTSKHSTAETPVIRAEVAAPTVEEVLGEGVLAPTLIVALGGLARQVLHEVRHRLGNRFGAPQDALPHVRVLALDTDPNLAKIILQENPSIWKLGPQQVLPVPLHRPSHYLKPRDNLPNLDRWLNPAMIYRIPRDQRTQGARALGRLAFCDNYRSIARRLKSELSAALAPAAIEHGMQETGLKQWTNYPQVFVVSSTMGGAGSGMLVDTCYLIRDLLELRGYPQAKVRGVLLTPQVQPAEESSSGASLSPLLLGNTFATLSELQHYSHPEQKFSALYTQGHAPVSTAKPPLDSCALFAVPTEKEKEGTRQVLARAGEFLARQLCTGLGRSIQQAHQEQETASGIVGQTYEMVGIYHVCYPRAHMVRQVARRLCNKLVGDWGSNDATPIVSRVQGYVFEEWRGSQLNGEALAQRINERTENKLGNDPEAMINSALLPLIRRQAGSSRGRGMESPGLAPPDLLEMLKRLEELVGNPADDRPGKQGSLGELICETVEKLTNYWSQKLAELPVRIIEKPTFRLAGAEEAVRQVVARLQEVLNDVEPRAKNLLEQARQAHEQVHKIAALLDSATPSSKRPQLSISDIVELLRSFAVWRHEGLALQGVVNVFVSLRGHLTDELREIHFCRSRLTELSQLLETDQPLHLARTSQSHLSPGGGEAEIRESTEFPGEYLYPPGCSNMEEAIRKTLAEVTPEQLIELDQHIQKMIRKDYRALVQICLDPANRTRDVAVSMRAVAEAWLNTTLPTTEVADILLDRYPTGDDLKELMLRIFEEAMPQTLTNEPQEDFQELVLVDAPPGASGDYLRDVGARSLPNTQVVSPIAAQDLLLYREWFGLALENLEQLGPVAQEAYERLLQGGQFTPHVRMDVDFQVPGEQEEQMTEFSAPDPPVTE